jgi:glycerol-3-phosphate O-acyltransferase
MVSGKTPKLSFFQLASMIGKEKGKLGRVFCDFGTPINIKDYLINIKVNVLNASNIDNTAVKLTEKLYEEHQSATTINLSIIAATLLLHD